MLPSEELDSHYKAMVYQPTQIAMANDLDACQHSLLRYIMRWKAKNGVKDLKQARNLLDQYIHYVETGEWVNQEDLHGSVEEANDEVGVCRKRG